MQAGYLLTVAFGNAFVSITATLPIPRVKFTEVYEFAFFSAFILIFMAVFLIMVRNYQYKELVGVETPKIQSEAEDVEKKY
jgi:hypothetical protein